MQSPLQKKKNFFFTYLFLAALGLHCCTSFCFVLFCFVFFLVTASRAYCLAAVHGLLIMVAFLVVEHRLYGMWAQKFRFPGSSTGSVEAHGLSCSPARGIFSGQESNLCLLHWQADSLPLNLQGSPHKVLQNCLERKLFISLVPQAFSELNSKPQSLKFRQPQNAREAHSPVPFPWGLGSETWSLVPACTCSL